MRTTSYIVLLCSIVTLISACGGGSDAKPPDPTQLAQQTATAVSASFDPNVLTALVLQPSDVHPGLPLRPGFQSTTEDVVILDFIYGDTNSYRIISTVGRSTDGDQRIAAVKRQRQTFITFVGDESNLVLADSDRAFVYAYTTSEIAALATRGDFFVAVRIASPEARPIPVMRQEITGYMQLAVSKLNKYLENPSAVTPVPGTITYEPPIP